LKVRVDVMQIEGPNLVEYQSKVVQSAVRCRCTVCGHLRGRCGSVSRVLRVIHGDSFVGRARPESSLHRRSLPLLLSWSPFGLSFMGSSLREVNLHAGGLDEVERRGRGGKL
jgi:hypothetical protein